jgi:Tfp pilus assembly protein PilV
MHMLPTFRTTTSSGRLERRLEPRSEAGFTLIEALMAAVILVVGLIGLLGLLDVSVRASASTRAREGATSLAREIL